MGAGRYRRAEKKAVAVLDHDLKWSGKSAAATVLNARFGSQVERPEADDRTQFWLNTFHLVARERPYTYGAPLPIRPLSIVDLIERLGLPAELEEAVAIVCALDDCWMNWRDSKQGSKNKNPP